MKLLFVFLFAVATFGQIADAPPDKIAEIPVNYADANSGSYTLPDPLLLTNRKPVKDAKTWQQKRRPEIVHLFQSVGVKT